MVASVGRITAGRGYDYLVRDVATSKHDYYTGRGEAPGVWSGAGCALIGLSGEVTAAEMDALYGRFVVPSTAPSGIAPDGTLRKEVVLGRRVSARVRADGSVAEPVAAFDVTFSPAKSVSVLFGLTADESLREQLIATHEDAVDAGLEYLETHAGHTRAGAGGVVKVPGDGFVIARFRHRTARSTDPENRPGDPQLHTHCAILNRVRGVDGVWRTLDSKALYRHAHAAGAVYAAALESILTERFGASWREPADRVAMRDLDGVPTALVDQFSSRRRQVLDHYDDALGEWWAVHGRSPLPHEHAALLDEATVRSRSPKVQADVSLYEVWAASITAADQTAVDTITTELLSQTGAGRDGGRIEAGSPQLIAAVVERLQSQRAWWTRAHIAAEVARLVASPDAATIARSVEDVAAVCVNLTPDDDPTYADPDHTSFTSEAIQRAETHVLDATTEPSPVHVTPFYRDELGVDQRDAVRAVCTGTHRVMTVIGPAGAGKTTMLRSVADSFDAAGVPMLVMATQRKAAQVVTDETGIPATSIASWEVGAVDLPRNGVVIIDEASMTPTLNLEQLVRTTRAYNTKLVLIGDWAQIGAPAAGGLLRDLAATDSAVELVSVRRFRDSWERAASQRLRTRNPDVVDAYHQHDRIREVTADTMLDTIADAWFADVTAGRSSMVVVDTNAMAAELSGLCQQRLMAAGRLGDNVGVGRDRNQLRIGDLIQTRRNAELATSDGRRVLNRDVWRITHVDDHGTVYATHTTATSTVAIPANYVTEHVQLAYASTIHGAQGATVDVGHVAVTPRTDAAGLYVGMTRGKHHNTAWCVTDGHDHDEHRTGHRSGPAAFADATRRSKDGQTSATRVADQWRNDATQRRTERRAADQQRFAVHRLRNWLGVLPPAGRAALTDTHRRELVAALIELPDTVSTNAILDPLIRGLDWNNPHTADIFVARVRDAVSDTGHHHSSRHDRPAGASVEHER